MSTARDLIAASLRTIGVLASGEAAQAAEASDALTTLNQLIDSWSNESLLIPNKVREVFPLVAGTQSYTMGTGGAFNTTRPQRIEEALLLVTSSTPALELPLTLLTKEQYAEIRQKALTTTYPQSVYADQAYPLTTLTLYPVPTASNNLVLYSWKALAQLANLSTSLSLPPGYERALKFALAIELAPEYGKGLAPELVELAAQSKSAIKRMNSRPRYLKVDSALTARAGTWNWMTGES